MRDKKKSESGEASEQEKLVQHVDSMMSTELPSDIPPKPVVMADEPDDKKLGDKKSAAKAPKDQKTAPELPANLKDAEAEATKITKLETPAKPPIVISLSDEDKTPEEQSDTSLEETSDEASDEPTPETKPLPTADKDPLEDKDTDKAVDDIVAHEGDTVLAVNDALTARKQAAVQPGQPSGPRRSHKMFWIVVLIILLGTAADAAIYLLRR